jgi:hypothetical protein
MQAKPTENTTMYKLNEWAIINTFEEYKRHYQSFYHVGEVLDPDVEENVFLSYCKAMSMHGREFETMYDGRTFHHRMANNG